FQRPSIPPRRFRSIAVTAFSSTPTASWRPWTPRAKSLASLASRNFSPLHPLLRHNLPTRCYSSFAAGRAPRPNVPTTMTSHSWSSTSSDLHERSRKAWGLSGSPCNDLVFKSCECPCNYSSPLSRAFPPRRPSRSFDFHQLHRSRKSRHRRSAHQRRSRPLLFPARHPALLLLLHLRALPNRFRLAGRPLPGQLGPRARNPSV